MSGQLWAKFQGRTHLWLPRSGRWMTPCGHTVVGKPHSISKTDACATCKEAAA